MKESKKTCLQYSRTFQVKMLTVRSGPECRCILIEAGSAGQLIRRGFEREETKRMSPKIYALETGRLVAMVSEMRKQKEKQVQDAKGEVW